MVDCFGLVPGSALKEEKVANHDEFIPSPLLHLLVTAHGRSANLSRVIIYVSHYSQYSYFSQAADSPLSLFQPNKAPAQTCILRLALGLIATKNKVRWSGRNN